MDLATTTISRGCLRAVLVALIALGLPALLIGFWVWRSMSAMSQALSFTSPDRPGMNFVKSETHGALLIETWHEWGGCCAGDGFDWKSLTPGLGKTPLVYCLGGYSISPNGRWMVASDSQIRQRYGEPRQEESFVLVDLTLGIIDRWQDKTRRFLDRGAWSPDGERYFHWLIRDDDVWFETIDFPASAAKPVRVRLPFTTKTLASYGELPDTSWSPSGHKVAALVYPPTAGNLDIADLYEFDLEAPNGTPPNCRRVTVKPWRPRIGWVAGHAVPLDPE